MKDRKPTKRSQKRLLAFSEAEIDHQNAMIEDEN